MNLTVFGERVKACRIQRGAPQSVLAELLTVTVTQISDIEHGKTGTTMERLALLADYFEVSADYLMGRTDKREVNR